MTDRLLHHAFVERAAEQPERTAIVAGDRRVAYGELDSISDALAGLMIGAGCRAGDRVAILAPKCPEAIAGMLAALKAGSVYVPLDVASPAARVGRIVERSRPRWILSSTSSAGLLDAVIAAGIELDDMHVVHLGDGVLEGQRFRSMCSIDEGVGPPPRSSARPDSAAHVMFTSGSTGQPKGVVITHANVLAFLDWALEHFRLRSDDRNSSQPPLHFDLSTFDVFGTLAAGAELHLIAPELTLLPHKISAYIREAELTQWFSVPSILNYLARFDTVRHGDFPGLRRLMWCGEVLPTPVLIYLMERLPHVRFTNLYGPTEATIASSYHEVRSCPVDRAVSIPIGRPCGGEEIVVLDSDLRRAPHEQRGQLGIRGVGLSPGYWEDEETTARAFVDADGQRTYLTGDLGWCDRDGVFHFAGRADEQIKSRGYRIELGEIESAFHGFEELKEVAVVAVDTDGFEGKAICCAYRPAMDRADLSPSDLRLRLSNSLPAYMLPTRWRSLPELPKNANGKIDRPALRRLFSDNDG